MASRRGPDNSVRLAVSGTLRGQNWANVFHYQLTTSSSISQADLDTWTSTIFGYYKTRFGPLLGSDCSIISAKAVLYTPGGGELISNATGTVAGSIGSASIAGAMSKVVSWLTTVYWRGGKPRTYLPTVVAADLTAGTDTLTAASKTALQTAAAGFRTDANAYTVGTITGTSFGFVSFRSGNADRAVPLFFAVTGATIHSRVGTQRRRDGKWQQ